MDDKIILKYLYRQEAEVLYNIDRNNMRGFELNEELEQVREAIRDLEEAVRKT